LPSLKSLRFSRWLCSASVRLADDAISETAWLAAPVFSIVISNGKQGIYNGDTASRAGG